MQTWIEVIRVKEIDEVGNWGSYYIYSYNYIHRIVNSMILKCTKYEILLSWLWWIVLKSKAGIEFVAEGRLILASNVAKEEKTAFWVVEKK